MVTVREQIDSTNFNNTAEVQALLDRANTRVSFWGSRLITFDGYTGSIYWDELRDMTLKELPQRNIFLPLKLRAKVDMLGLQVNEQFSNSNLLTHILRFTRLFFSLFSVGLISHHI